MVPETLIMNWLRICKVSDKVINFITEFMKNWKVELTVRGKISAEVKIQRGIFRVDAFSPLLFVTTMIPLNHILRKCTGDTNLQSHKKGLVILCTWVTSSCQKKLIRLGDSDTSHKNIHRWYRDEIWYRKTCYIRNEKCKRWITEEIQMPNQERIRSIGEKENYKHLGILKANTIKQKEM